MDIVNPMPRTVLNNRYFLTVVDNLTKHVETYPALNQEADSFASLFLNEFVARFEVCYVVHTN